MAEETPTSGASAPPAPPANPGTNATISNGSESANDAPAPSTPSASTATVASHFASTPVFSAAGGESFLDTVMGTVEHEEEGSTPNPSAHGPISKPKKFSGLFGTSSNLVNSIVGAGIVGIPYALSQSGLIAGIFLLILVSWLTDKSLRIIVELASFHPKLKNRGVMTYEDLMSYPYGSWGNAFILINMFVLAYGAMVAYLLIIKDTVPTILGVGNGMEGGIERELIMLVTTLVIIVPLSMQRDMASLAFTSVLSVSADIILVIFVSIYSPVKESVSDAGGLGEVLKKDWLNPTVFIGLGILSTAMACQHSAFIVSGSLFNKTSARWGMVACYSLTFACILCLILGVTGYLGFLDETQGNVLNNFPPDSVESNAARALLAITMFFTYPMESLVARHVLVRLIYGGDMDGEVDEDGDHVRVFWCFQRRHVMTLGLYVLTLIPAFIFQDLGPVLSITGSLGGSCVSYIAPGMVYLGINGDTFLQYIGNILDNHRQKKSKDGATGDIELPVAGDADQTMQTQEVAYEAEGSKPWWWYPLLMPIWCSLASKGATSMKERLEQQERDGFQGFESPPRNGQPEVEDFHPRVRDYWISMFFIVFGVIAAVAGVFSNIYVQVNNIFFSPH